MVECNLRAEIMSMIAEAQPWPWANLVLKTRLNYPNLRQVCVFLNLIFGCRAFDFDDLVSFENQKY